MSYLEMKKTILNIFDENNFIQLYNNKQQKKVMLSNCIDIVFPGYKTKIQDNKYDYRVEYNQIPLSHVNIIVDLYNKAIQAPHLIDEIKRFLIYLAIKGDEINMANFPGLLNYNFDNPSNDLLNFVLEAHNRINKQYLLNGNRNKNYSFYELAAVIPIIVLQEDINYPMPRYQGRRMSFYRYYEAIMCNSYGELEDVINRALTHDFVPFYRDLDYSEIKNLRFNNIFV